MSNMRELHTDLLQMESMFHSIREEAVVFFKQYFRVLGKTEVELSDEVWVTFWNRGFDFKVKKIIFENENVLCKGEYHGQDNQTEFLSYIYHMEDLKKILGDSNVKILLVPKERYYF